MLTAKAKHRRILNNNKLVTLDLCVFADVRHECIMNARQIRERKIPGILSMNYHANCNPCTNYTKLFSTR